MWSRRAFLQHGSLALAALASFDGRSAETRVGPLNRPIGLQLYTIREDVQKDLPAALKAVSAIGYREVELYGGVTLAADKLKALLSENSLTAPSMHAGMSDLQTDLQKRIDYATAIGAKHLVVSFPWTKDSRFKSAPQDSGATIASGMTLDDWKWNADELNRIGAITKKSGIRVGYHNHNIEFRPNQGTTGYDELLKHTDPALVDMQLDIGWVVTAGIDPLKYLKGQADRIVSLHVKDVRKGAKITADRMDSQTTEVGSGQIDWPKLFAGMKADRVKHVFVEQENFDRAPLEAVKVSFNYLSQLGKRSA